MSQERPIKPSRLPAQFKAPALSWKPVNLPAPVSAAEYLGGAMTRLQKAAQAGGLRPKMPKAMRAKNEIEVKPQTLTVLVCETDYGLRESLEDCLNVWGFRVIVASNAHEAWACVERGETPHILVCAAQLEDLGTTELVAQFTTLIADIEIILLAGRDEIPNALAAKGERVHELVMKPIARFDELRAAMANASIRVQSRLYMEYLASEFDRVERNLEIEARVAAELSENADLASVIDIGTRGISEIFGDGIVVFFQYLSQQRSLTASGRFPAKAFAGGQPRLMIPVDVGSDIASIRGFLADLEKNADFRNLMRQASQMSPELTKSGEGAVWHTAVLETRGIPRGVVAVLPKSWNEKTDSARLQRNVRNLSKSYEIALLHAKLLENATQDSFTGLANDKFLNRRLGEEMKKAARLSHPLTLLVMRALPGNEKSLRFLARLLNANFRTTDILAYRGEEGFAAVLPHTAFVDALGKADQFRHLVNQASEGGIQVAIGLAEFPGHAAQHEELLFAAEAAVQESLTQQGNTIQIAEVRPGYVPPYVPTSTRSTAFMASSVTS